MPKTQLADIIIPLIYTRALIERTTSLHLVRNCGVLDRNSYYDQLAAGAGKSVNLPFFQDLTGNSQVLSDSGSLTPAKVTEVGDLAAINSRGQAWQVNQLTKYVTGDDPLGRIVDFGSEWWFRDEQTTVLKQLDGMFDNATGVLRVTHRNNIYADVASPATANKLTGSSFVDTTVKLGDHSTDLVVCCMHSDVEASLRKSDLITAQRDSTGARIIETFQGRRFFVDDNCPKVAGTNSPSYMTYFFGLGAFAYGDGTLGGIPENEQVEFQRDILANDTTLVNRRRYIIHPKGVKWIGTPAGVSPTDAEYAVGTNWTKVYSDKNIRIVACKHNV